MIHSPLTRFLKIRLFKVLESKHWGHRGKPSHALHLTPHLLQLISFTCWVKRVLDRNSACTMEYFIWYSASTCFMKGAQEASKVNDLPKVTGKVSGENGNRTVCPDHPLDLGLRFFSVLFCDTWSNSLGSKMKWDFFLGLFFSTVRKTSLLRWCLISL